MKPTADELITTSGATTVVKPANSTGQRLRLHFRGDTKGWSKGWPAWWHMTGIPALLAVLILLILLILFTWLSAGLATFPRRALASSSLSGNVPSTLITIARPTLTPSTEFAGMPVIYAGAGDGSWPDQMEPNDGADDLLGPAPVEVGTLYRSLNLLPRTQPAPNPTLGEDRDWYVWNVTMGQCYRAFTGDVTGQLTGKGKVQHAIRMWWYPPVREGRKLLAEYNPSMGPTEGGYFASARACADADGQMAAEVFNYGYALKNPRGATYTFGVIDVGPPVAEPVAQPAPLAQAAPPVLPSNASGSYAPRPALANPHTTLSTLPRVQQPTSLAPSPSQDGKSVSSPSTPTNTNTSLPSASTATSATPFPSTSLSPTPSPTSPPKPGSPGLPASVDVVAYLDQNQNGAPDPGEGLLGLRVALLSVRTNSVQKTVSTNVNGHARLEWTWAGRVRVSLPDLNWSDLVDPYTMASASRPRSDVWSTAEDGSLYLEVRVLPARLPAVIP